MTIQEQAKSYMQQSNVTQAHFGRLVGVAESTISRWLKGTYPNPEAIDLKVKDFLEKEKVRETIVETSDIGFVMTGISKSVWQALEYGRIQRTISVIYGDAGIGKTRTMQEWAKDKSDVIIVTANPAVKSPKGFFKLLARRLKTTFQGSLDDIFIDIMDKLMMSDRTIVIDEAQHLNKDTLELIRSINDSVSTAIILMGNEIIYNKMLGKKQAEFAQLFTRIGMKKHLLTDYFTEKDVSEIFNLTDSAAIQFLLEMCKSKFSLRGAMHVYINSQNNGDVSEKGLKAMSKVMGIMI